MPGVRLSRVTKSVIVAAALVLITGIPAPVSAQNPVPDPQQLPRVDFLFGRPSVSLGVRGSWVFARAGSDLFDFVTRELTIDRGDFNSPGFGVDVGFALNSRLDIVGGVETSRMSVDSEYRDLVDNLFLPIQQSTSLRTVQLNAGLRFALTPRGHDVSRFAWVPRRVVPFVGGGGGLVYYNFSQQGDFVDFVDFSVFTDSFRSNGWAPSANAYGGVDVQLYRSLFGTFDARYVWASADLSRDFIDFDPIDLAGFRMSGGINVFF